VGIDYSAAIVAEAFDRFSQRLGAGFLLRRPISTLAPDSDPGRGVMADGDERKRHAVVEKAAVDRERAIRNVCRLYGVKTLDWLLPGIR
jgi:hypothetical protein